MFPCLLFSVQFSIVITSLRERTGLYASSYICLFILNRLLSFFVFRPLGLAAACECDTPRTFLLTIDRHFIEY